MDHLDYFEQVVASIGLFAYFVENENVIKEVSKQSFNSKLSYVPVGALDTFKMLGLSFIVYLFNCSVKYDETDVKRRVIHYG